MLNIPMCCPLKKNIIKKTKKQKKARVKKHGPLKVIRSVS